MISPLPHSDSAIWLVPGRNATEGPTTWHEAGATLGRDANRGEVSSASRRASVVSGVTRSSTAFRAKRTEASGSIVRSLWLSTASAWALEAVDAVSRVRALDQGHGPAHKCQCQESRGPDQESPQPTAGPSLSFRLLFSRLASRRQELAFKLVQVRAMFPGPVENSGQAGASV